MGIGKSITTISVVTIVLICVTTACFFGLGIRILRVHELTDNARVMDQAIMDLRDSLYQQTHKARLYIHDPRANDAAAFDVIIAEREGHAPRQISNPVAPGETIAALDLAAQTSLGKTYLPALQKAKLYIDQLSAMGTEAIKARSGLYKDETGAYTVRKAPDLPFAWDLVFGSEYIKAFEKAVDSLDDSRSQLHSTSLEIINTGKDQITQLFVLAFVLLLGMLVSMCTLMRYWRRYVLNPLVETRHFAEKVANGQLDATISQEGHNEISLLRSAIVHMAESLKARLESLQQAETLASEKAEEAQQACRRAEEGLIIAKDASRTKSDFLARMSHEIRTPMNAIIGMSYLCLQKELGETQRDYIVKIHAAGNNLLGIINDILDYSRIEAGKMRVLNAPFRVVALLDSLASLVTMKSKEKQVEMLFHVGNTVPPVLVGDMLRLAQIMTNLASNAYKFTEQGEIVVSVTLREDLGESVRVRFSVQDTGIGISPEQQAHVFESFSQVDSSMTRRHGGVGLGLSIVSHLVGLMGGEIKVESTLGVGSTFFFEVVMNKCDSSALPLSVQEVNFAGLRALVVDDSATARKIFTDMLEHFDMSVTAVNSGEAALQLLAEDSAFSLVVLDWKMGGIDGVETLHRLRAMRGMERTPPVMLVSAYNVEDVYSHCENIPNVRVLAKPVNHSVFFENVCAALGAESLQFANIQQEGDKRAPNFGNIAGAHVLVVEDNELNQQIAREILESTGVQVTVVENGLEGVQAALTGEFDLVLMDVQMPVMDGLEATRRIRAAGFGMADLPIVALTAHAASHDKEKSLQAGVNEHLTKPVSAESLYGSLSHWLGNKSGKGEKPVAATKAQAAAPASVRENLRAGSDGVVWPESLPGLQVKAGLANVVQNKTLYQNLLCRFVDKYSASPQEFVELIAQQQFEEGRRLAHTVKGVAANLGALDLSAAAREMEQELGKENTIKQSLPHYIRQLEVLLEAVNVLAPQCKMPGVNTVCTLLTDEDKEAMHSLLKGIAEKMQMDWGSVSDALTSSLPVWEQSIYAEDFRAVVRAVEDFDAGTVHQKAENLRSRLKKK